MASRQSMSCNLDSRGFIDGKPGAEPVHLSGTARRALPLSAIPSKDRNAD